MLFPSLLAKGLSRVLEAVREAGPIPLGEKHRYVIFSDHHKGAGTDADDFKDCKETYLAALAYYFEQGYHLIILGDAEELWEEPIEKVIKTYGDVFDAEKEFHAQGRFLKIFGNHDNNWASQGQIEKHLHPMFPGLKVTEGLLFTYTGPDAASSGELFLAHGHQGTLDSEVFPSISRFFVRTVWRTVQIVTHYSGTQPSKDDRLRGEHDTLMYEWAVKQGKLLLMAGHTHREIWSSRTRLEQKLFEIRALEKATESATVSASASAATAELEAEMTTLKDEYEALKATEVSEYDTVKTRGCYFNDGCCSFRDGSVTAYELEDGTLRLVRWDLNADEHRDPVVEAPLADIFFEL